MTEYSEGMTAWRRKVLAEHPEIETVRDLAPLMGEYEEEYLDWALYRPPGRPPFGRHPS